MKKKLIVEYKKNSYELEVNSNSTVNDIIIQSCNNFSLSKERFGLNYGSRNLSAEDIHAPIRFLNLKSGTKLKLLPYTKKKKFNNIKKKKKENLEVNEIIKEEEKEEIVNKEIVESTILIKHDLKAFNPYDGNARFHLFEVKEDFFVMTKDDLVDFKKKDELQKGFKTKKMSGLTI